MSAASVTVSTVLHQRTGAGSTPSAALHPQSQFTPKEIVIKPVSHSVTRQICIKKHYLHSYPGESLFNFGILASERLLGVAVLDVGPANLRCLFRDAQGHQVLCLTRLWLDNRLGRNSESRALAIILRQLRQHQSLVKAIVVYSDPLVGHNGGIYRAAGFLYLGQSTAMPKYQLPDGRAYHSRSLSHGFGTHSLRHFQSHGVKVELVPQAAKFTYVALIDPTWRERRLRPPQPYPKREIIDESH
jgi:hypothetical protein